MLYLGIMERLSKKFNQKNAQTAIEYLILLSLVAVIVIVSFSNLFPRANQAVSSLFSRAGLSIMGGTVQSIGGNWCNWGPCQDGTRKRLCDCPAPLGSGAVCSGSGTESCTIEE